MSKYLVWVGGSTPDDETAKLVFEITGGHPATLRLVQELIWGRGVGPAGRQVKTDDSEPDLNRLTTHHEERAAELVESLVKRLDEPVLLDAVRAAAVPRRFDEPLLRALLKKGRQRDTVEQPWSSGELFVWLRDLPFMEPASGKMRRVHEYVRESILIRLQVTDPDGLEELHGRAASFYASALTKHKVRTATDTLEYGDFFLMEKREWQDKKREWLYHAARLTGDEHRHGVVLEAARLFLDAFWWWGNYVHFDFCDQLLADLELLVSRREATEPDASGHRDGEDVPDWPQMESLYRGLSELVAEYPLRSQKTPHADWPAVRAALVRIQMACKLDTLPARPTERQRHISALLCIFMAHTWRYQAHAGEGGTDDRRLAEQMYRLADERLGPFRGLKEDRWDRAWVVFELADMLWTWAFRDEPPAREVLARIDELWGRAARIAQPVTVPGGTVEQSPGVDPTAPPSGETDWSEVEHELSSNLHRLRGDIHRALGRLTEAAQSYGRAVLHAYLFHIIGGPPDEYTLQFHVDAKAWAISFVRDLWVDEKEALAVECSLEMKKASGPAGLVEQVPTEAHLRQLLTDASAEPPIPVPLANALFVPGPVVRDLGVEGSAYATTVGMAFSVLDPRVSMDLHSPA
ncbi:hypothetical protein [Cellulomonas sp. Leaf395]|uniref:hypothetical protein n=1 Tax=Cellulomonas sp. Leaf395 TaxID=1736362 RepID=UPI0012F7A1ED|nr:hypothetical protein [Cellulomonas sp. Leaf395]